MKPPKIISLYDRDGNLLGAYEEHYYRLSAASKEPELTVRTIRLKIDGKSYSVSIGD